VKLTCHAPNGARLATLSQEVSSPLAEVIFNKQVDTDHEEIVQCIAWDHAAAEIGRVRLVKLRCSQQDTLSQQCCPITHAQL